MRYGDVVTAVSATVILVIISNFLLGLAFRSLSISFAVSDLADIIQTIVAFFIPALIVGAVFAKRIWSENGLEAIVKMTLLSTVFLILYVINYPALPSYGTVVDQAIATAYPTTTFTATQMLSMETSVLANQVFTSVVIALAIGFIGFYIGSKLRKP
jgi:hypothetical protein